MFVFSLVFSLLTPAIMIFFGLLWGNHPPKEINDFAGYRTTWSKKSQSTWDFAHKHFCRTWRFVGIPLAIISAVAILFFNKSDDGTLSNVLLVIVGIQVVIMFLTIIPTEIALRKNFDEDGIRKKFD